MTPTNNTTMTLRVGTADDDKAIDKILTDVGLDPFDFSRLSVYHRIVALDEDGVLVGFIDGRFDVPIPDRATLAGVPGPQAWGSLIAVAPDRQRGGAAKLLLRALLEESQRRGCIYFSAMVSGHDDPAQRRAFFQAVGLEDLVPGVPDDIVGAPIEDVLRRLD
ncbi:putative N-acetyltransferase YhbS [Pseudonocardia alni]|uniref:N-acetyltransferase YhbS n=2 Tax=Pseudonocardia alni TaxID=33907 RepID=A0AA44ZNY3_PSEA5|nr:putative N-acetyltransferase YhbS [Pseudonocardia alni]